MTIQADVIVVNQPERLEHTFLKAMVEHFRGTLPLQEFNRQLKELTEADRADFKAAFEKEFNYRMVERIPGLEPTTGV